MTESYLQRCNIVVRRNHFLGEQSFNAFKPNKYMLNATVRRCRKEGKRTGDFLRLHYHPAQRNQLYIVQMFII